MSHRTFARPPFTRRELLEIAAVAAAAIPACAVVAPSITRADEKPTRRALRNAYGPPCRPTSADIEGPYYRADAPFNAQLAGEKEPGERLIVAGTVYGPDCRAPLAGAIVDLWQADAAGNYDNQDPDNPPNAKHFHLRGRIRTDAKGHYECVTVLPGRYPLGRGMMRPRHIHYRVTAPDRAPLTTQLYFAGDEFLAKDPWATPSRTIQLSKEKGVLRGTFHIILT